METYFRAPAANGLGMKLQRYENEICLNANGIDPEELYNFCVTFPYKSDDILVCGYPKCGNHWTDKMIWKLKTPDDSKRKKMTILELLDYDCYYNQGVPRVLHTHVRPSRLAKEHLNNGKIVVILRNPKDACVSFYHHLKGSTEINNGQTFNEFFESYFFGDMLCGSYIKYLQEWEEIFYANPPGTPDSNKEVFYFEDFKVNPMENLVRLNKFLGFERDQSYLNQVLEQTSFQAMKEAELKDKSKINEYCFNKEGQSLIYRSGRIGDWKNYFTVAQSERVDALLKTVLTKGIIKFSY